MTTSGEIVFCVLCVGTRSGDQVHVFSTPEKRKAWVDADESADGYVHYDYVVDHPERMTEVERRQ